MRHISLLAAILVFLVSGSGLALALEPSSRDFAYGLILEIEQGGSIYSLTVPDEVYRQARQPGLADIRVFNAAGEAMPHVLRIPAENEKGLRRQDNVPFFPLADGVVENGGNPADLELTVRRSADGMIVGIATDQSTGSGTTRNRAYLLDLSGIDGETGSLEFAWKNVTFPLTAVSLLESEDLVHWRPLVDRAPLAGLERGGYWIEQKRIPLPTRPRRYLKLVTREDQGLPELLKITAFSEKIATRQQRRWLTMAEGQIDRQEKRLAINYLANFHLPADAARIHFSRENSIINATLQSRPDPKSPWRNRCQAVFYSLNEAGAAIDNTLCTFEQTGDHYWRLEIAEDGAGLAGKAPVPTLDLGWTAAELLFIARGPGPYTLAYSSERLDSATARPAADMILQAVAAKGQDLAIRPARPGSQIELGGQAVLQPPSPPLLWKKWLLWAVLILGVCVLAFMVRSLLREMGGGN